jgi:serine/threonine protein kinase/tetratricopeptide (TPR) repeat protein
MHPSLPDPTILKTHRKSADDAGGGVRPVPDARARMSSQPAATPPTTPSAPGVVLERGQSIDRFVVIGMVGRGGMGEVYAAYDPDLDRKVAIKLLRARGGDNGEGATRLLREAQAIAKLQHPNVVVVYDVGTFGESVFIAMEFVEGRTLGGWMHAGTRSQKDILNVFHAAGLGLAAAHAAGLVHRDFKPDNVMVLNDGQVRVMDFGLARQTGEATEAQTEPPPSPEALARFAAAAVDEDATMNLGTGGAAAVPEASSGKYLGLKLTLTGAMLGTPAYMAPEQFAVQPTDARTDQFSFCVALYELLYGQRPFEGADFLSLMTNVATGTVRPAPAKSRVPAWLRKVILRGLETDPEKRYPTMAALLTALETDPTVKRRRLAASAGVLLCVAAAAVGVKRNLSSHRNLCGGGPARLAGIWEPGGAASARKDAIRGAFAATGKSYAAQAFASASHLLDEYVAKWLDMYGDACQATHVRGEQSTEVLDLRMSCLQERLSSVRALGEVFAKANGDVVQNAVTAAGALPRIERCADVALLKEVVKPPEDPHTRARVEALREEKARVVALRDAGRCTEALKLADELIPRVKEVGYLPLVAETLEAGSPPQTECMPIPAKIERLKEAFAAAVASHHDEIAAKEATLIGTYSTMVEIDDQKAGQTWLPIARSSIARIGGNTLLQAWSRAIDAGLAMHDRDWNAALAAYQQARSEKVKVLGPDHPDVGLSDINIGFVLQLAGHADEAVDTFDAAVTLLSRVLGPDHPSTMLALYNKADALTVLHRYGEARAAFEECLQALTKAGGDSFILSYVHTGLGISLLGESKAADAVAPLEEALKQRLGPDTDAEHRGETRFALARALWSRPEARDRARALAREARADYAQVKTAAATVAAIDAWLAAPRASL